MKIRFLLLALALAWASTVQAQVTGFGSVPVEINVGEGGEQKFEGGVAIAEKDVVIHYGTTSLYADHAEYNPDTHDVLLIGNVRIYTEGHLFVGDRALYNLETKLLRAQNFRGDAFPFFFQAQALSSLEGGAFQASGATISTSDSSKPDFRIGAKTARIYPKDHIVLSNVTVYAGNTPVFWFPYVYQSLKGNLGFNFIPGYSTLWGAYLLVRDGFPITDDLRGLAHIDLRSARGLAIGLDVNGTYGVGKNSWVHFRSYYAQDTDTSINTTAITRLPVSPDRYRISFQDRTFFTDDIYASFDINKLSDYIYLRDFNPNEYRNDPQPDNVISLTKLNDNYSVTATVRPQVNSFFDTTERLPELALDVKRQPLFGLPIFYESETGAARLSRKFGTDLTVLTATTNAAGKLVTVSTLFPASTLDYSANRFDTFHQLTMPETLGGWLSVIPRLGIRGTYYSNGATSLPFLLPPDPVTGVASPNSVLQKSTGSGVLRGVFDAGLETSFKLTRNWDLAQSRAWGLDGLRHVIQPFADFSFVRSTNQPTGILQFDRLNPSTQLPPIDFPQFTTIDTIPNWTILRLGVRNRLETRRDDSNIDWLWTESYLDYNIQHPNFPGFPTAEKFSNLVNRLVWTPLPWMTLNLDCQLPILNNGFTEVNTTANFRVNEDLRWYIGHRYLYGNQFFAPSSDLWVSSYYRINDNWAVQANGEYEFLDKPNQGVTPGLLIHSYQLHRDLSSWVASFGVLFRRSYNPTTGQQFTDVSVALTFTLKDLPSLGIPIAFDPSSTLSTQK